MCFISLLFDGSTDKEILDEEIMYIHYLLNNKPVTKFAGIKNPNKEDAQGILNAIVDLKPLKPSESISNDEYFIKVYKKLINGKFDGASVMNGYRTGAQTQI